jgi:hypothetical protein
MIELEHVKCTEGTIRAYNVFVSRDRSVDLSVHRGILKLVVNTYVADRTHLTQDRVQ